MSGILGSEAWRRSNGGLWLPRFFAAVRAGFCCCAGWGGGSCSDCQPLFDDEYDLTIDGSFGTAGTYRATWTSYCQFWGGAYSNILNHLCYWQSDAMVGQDVLCFGLWSVQQSYGSEHYDVRSLAFWRNTGGFCILGYLYDYATTAVDACPSTEVAGTYNAQWAGGGTCQIDYVV